MGSTTALIVPATVPDALVTRLPHHALERRPLVSAAPAAVPVASPVRVVLEHLSAADVAILRAENQRLRDELARARTR